MQKLTDLLADEDQLLLLFCDYVCTQKGTPMPWDEIAATLEPRDPANGEQSMTGEAVKQHLAKLRDHRIHAGLRVPPKLDRSARRQAQTTIAKVNGTIAFQTPAPTPKKSAGFVGTPVTGGSRVKKEAGTGVKASTLLASVNKTKQKKAEQTKKAQTGNTTRNTIAVRNSAGGVKTTTGKRGRKAKSSDDDYCDEHGATDPVPARHLRPVEQKGYAEVKAEQDSDDDLPLSKKVSRKEKPTIGLMNDTVTMWNNRGSAQACSSPQARPSTTHKAPEQSVQLPMSQDPGKQNAMAGEQQQRQQQNQANTDDNPQTPNSPVPQAFGLPASTSYGHTNDQVGNDVGSGPLLQFGYGYGYYQSGHKGSNIAFTGSQAPATYSQVNQHMIDNEPSFLSSPLDDSSSSNGCSNTGYNRPYSDPSSGNNSLNSSFGSGYQLHDPFTVPSHSNNGNLARLPSFTTGGNMGSFPSNSYASTPAAASSTSHSRYDYFKGQNSLGYQSQASDVAGSGAPVSQAPFDVFNAPVSQSGMHTFGNKIDDGFDDSQFFTLPANASELDLNVAPPSTGYTHANEFSDGFHHGGHFSSDFDQFMKEPDDQYMASLMDGAMHHAYATGDGNCLVL